MSKKILMVIPNFGFGGAQRVFSEHAKLFSQEYQVEECVFNMDLSNEYDAGHKTYSLEVGESSSIFYKMLNFFRRVQRLRKIKQENQYDFCISHLEGADYINILSRQSEKIILVVHGSKVADENMRGLTGFVRKKILLPWLYRKADLIITVSDGIKEELSEAYNLPSHKIISIPNYFDIEKIVKESKLDDNEEVAFLKKDNQVILYSGRFANQKNLLPLIHIFRLLKIERSKTKLVLIGDGELKEELFRECEKLNLNYYKEEDSFHELYDVYFLGYKKNPFPSISISDLFVMTSKWEGFPLALCEAMALGACVVSADCPTGPSQILSMTDSPYQGQKAGVLLPIPALNNNSLILWKDSLMNLLNDSEERNDYSIRAKERARSFSKDAVAKKWKAVLQ